MCENMPEPLDIGARGIMAVARLSVCDAASDGYLNMTTSTTNDVNGQ
jgi:hypothetical protein